MPLIFILMYLIILLSISYRFINSLRNKLFKTALRAFTKIIAFITLFLSHYLTRNGHFSGYTYMLLTIALFFIVLNIIDHLINQPSFWFFMETIVFATAYWAMCTMTIIFSEHTLLDFLFIVFAVTVLIIPLVYNTKYYLDKFKYNIEIAIALITNFILAELYILFLFGIYNLTHNNLFNKLSDTSSLKQWIRIIHFGAQNVFQLPQSNLNGSVVPFLQFFIAMIFNILIIGFLVSYATNLINKDN